MLHRRHSPLPVRLPALHHAEMGGVGVARPWPMDHGWGFVIAIALSKDRALATRNVVPFGVHLFGVYRYLVRKAAP